MEKNTETLIISKNGENFDIVIQHDQSGSAYGISLSKNIYEQLRLHFANDSLPFSKYHEFHNWIKQEGWFEASDMEYDNLKEPNSCIRLSIQELYEEYKRISV